MYKTAIYSLLITLMLAMLPMAAYGAPQTTDIKKPTRVRVKDKNSKNDDKNNKNDKKDDNRQNDKQAGKKDAKPATQPVQKKEEEAKKPEPKPATAEPKPTESKPVADTAKKPAEPPKPKVRSTLNPANTQFDGIDISKHQGSIDWAELKKNSKIKFVYIKATEGSDYIDPRYQENIRNARKHGFKVGSYHFLSTRSSATTQFKNFIATAKREDQDLLPVIDVEKLSPWTSQQLRDSIKVFADLLEDYYGCKPMIYTSEKFFTKNLGRAFADYPLFIAKYNSNQPNIGYKWIIWQFADNGSFKPAVKGNYGEVDMSRFNKGCTINDIIYTPSINMTEQKAKEAPKMSKKQQEEAKKKAEKENKAKERNKKLAEEEAKKKAEAEKKAKQKAEQQRREQARQQAREEEAKKEAEQKAKRKAEAQKAREQKAQRNAANKKSANKSANLLNTSSSKLSQSQRNDSIRNAKYKGRKTNKSSADND